MANTVTNRTLDLANWRSLPEETLLTLKEAAAVLRVSESKVRKALEKEKLPYYRPAADDESKGDYRIMMVDLLAYLEESRVSTGAACREETSPQATEEQAMQTGQTRSPGPSSRRDARYCRPGGRNARSSGRSPGPRGRR